MCGARARVSWYHALLQGCYCAPGLIVVMRFTGKAERIRLVIRRGALLMGSWGETLGWNSACFYSAYWADIIALWGT